MKKVAIVTDSNAGIRQEEAKELGIFVLPMPFTIDDQTYYEDINLTQEEFFEKQISGAEIFTSQPVVGNVKELWDQILKDYDEIVHIPMSSGLSGYVKLLVCWPKNMTTVFLWLIVNVFPSLKNMMLLMLKEWLTKVKADKKSMIF